MGKTVAELLNGRPSPLSNTEYEDWYHFYLAERELRKMAQNKAKGK